MNPTTPKSDELPIEKVREAVELLIRHSHSLGSSVGPTGGTCVMVRMQDFAGLEHYLRASWVDNVTKSQNERLVKALEWAVYRGIFGNRWATADWEMWKESKAVLAEVKS